MGGSSPPRRRRSLYGAFSRRRNYSRRRRRRAYEDSPTTKDSTRPPRRRRRWVCPCPPACPACLFVSARRRRGVFSRRRSSRRPARAGGGRRRRMVPSSRIPGARRRLSRRRMISRARRGTRSARTPTRARAWGRPKRRPGGWRGEEGGVNEGTGDERRNARRREIFHGGEPRSRWAGRRRVKTRSGARWFFAFGFRPLAEVRFGRAFEGARRTDSSLPPAYCEGYMFLHLSCAGPGGGGGGRERAGERGGRPEIRRFARSGKRPPGRPGKTRGRAGRIESFAHLQVDVRALMQDLGERRVLLNQPPLPRAVFLHALAQGVLLLRGPLRGEIGGGSGNASAPRKPEEIEGDVVEFRAGGRAPRVELGRRGADRATLAGDAPSSWGRP